LVKTGDFDYALPSELISQKPAEPRDRSRLMILDRHDGSIRHQRFFEIARYLHAGDILVFNNSRTINARLVAKRVDTGGRVEILLLRRLEEGIWEALVKPGKRLHTGARIEIVPAFAPEKQKQCSIQAEVIELKEGGIRVISFSDETALDIMGKVPLPPYIHEPLVNPERYQTVYSKVPGSVASPTAGLHFTPKLISQIEGKGVRCLFVTLHAGLDTFRPVQVEDPREHQIHSEYGVLDGMVAAELSRARAEGKRVICVGTTTARLLEAAAQASSPARLQAFEDWVSLFILPGYRFMLVDALVTNFHLPKSTLLMLVTAFAGRELVTQAYQEAIAQKYHFYSFGDAMLIT